MTDPLPPASPNESIKKNDAIKPVASSQASTPPAKSASPASSEHQVVLGKTLIDRDRKRNELHTKIKTALKRLEKEDEDDISLGTLIKPKTEENSKLESFLRKAVNFKDLIERMYEIKIFDEASDLDSDSQSLLVWVFKLDEKDQKDLEEKGIKPYRVKEFIGSLNSQDKVFQNTLEKKAYIVTNIVNFAFHTRVEPDPFDKIEIGKRDYEEFLRGLDYYSRFIAKDDPDFKEAVKEGLASSFGHLHISTMNTLSQDMILLARAVEDGSKGRSLEHIVKSVKDLEEKKRFLGAMSSRLSAYIPVASALKAGESLINSLPESEYQLLIDEPLNYRDLAREAISNGHLLKLKLAVERKGFGFKDCQDPMKWEIFEPFLSPDTRKVFTEKLVDRINRTKHLPDAKWDSDYGKLLNYSNEFFLSIMGHLTRKVGAIQNPEMLKAIYKMRSSRILRLSNERYEALSKNEYHRDRQISFDQEQSSENLGQFFLYNPSKEILKAAFDFWHQPHMVGAKERKLLTKAEHKSLLWLLSNIPKSNRGRDQRRRLHDFVLELVQSRAYIEIQNDARGRVLQERRKDSLVEFKSKLIQGIKENYIPNPSQLLEEAQKLMRSLPEEEQTKQKLKAMRNNIKKNYEMAASKYKAPDINALMDFIALFNSYKKETRARQAITTESKSLNDVLADMEVKYYEKAHYEELKAASIKSFLNSFSRQALYLQGDELKRVTDSIEAYPKIWNKDNFLIDLVKYHDFQEDEAKKRVEKYMLILANSKVDTEKKTFKDIDRDECFDAFTQEWLGDRSWMSDYKVNLDIGELDFDPRTRYGDIWKDIIVHLNLEKGSLASQKDKLQERFSLVGKTDQFEEFRALLEELSKELDRNDLIEPQKISAWFEKARRMRLYDIFPGWSEFLINLSQLHVVSRAKDTEIETADFRINDDPLEFVRSGEKPYFTCQRIVEKTAYNRDARPINRAMSGNFFLAQSFVNGEVDTRSILEIAEGQSKTDKEPKKTVLAERFYTAGLTPRKIFQEQMINSFIEKDPSVKYLVLSGLNLNPSEAYVEEISLQTLNIGAEVYRDTHWGDKVLAINLEKYKESKSNKDAQRDDDPYIPAASVGFSSL